jgi:hypothetical protein
MHRYLYKKLNKREPVDEPQIVEKCDNFDKNNKICYML